MTELEIQHFKCFKKIKVPINQLTVLAGANGQGKSTTVQALLLLRAVFEKNQGTLKLTDLSLLTWNDRMVEVELNGPFNMALGTAEAILNNRVESGVESIKIGIRDEGTNLNVEFSSENPGGIFINSEITDHKIDGEPALLFPEFYYLNAERLGPRVSQSIKHFPFPNTGFQGEFVAQLLGDTNFNYSFKVDEKRRFPGLKAAWLNQQVNAWLSFIMPGIQVSANFDPITQSAQVKVDGPFSDQVLSTNIGFGISYVLPIIVTGLIARKGAYMIVENPEAHLHPSAQSKIGRFLAMIANTGVKVIIETHSDHVLNGIQVSAAKGDINSGLVTVNYFGPNEGDGKPFQPLLKSLSMNEKGDLSEWPQGFFDQTQQDYAQLIQLRKG